VSANETAAGAPHPLSEERKARKADVVHHRCEVGDLVAEGKIGAVATEPGPTAVVADDHVALF